MFVTLIPQVLKSLVKDRKVELKCDYAGCGASDSWPTRTI